MTEEEKKAQEEALALVQKAAKEEAEKASKEYVDKSLETKGYVSKEDADKSAQELVTKAVNEVKTEMQKSVDAVSASLKAFKQTSKTQGGEEVNNIETVLKSAIIDGAEELKAFKGDSVKLVVKEITDTSFTGDSLAHATTSVRPGLYQSPYNPFYLRNIFPNVPTEDGIIVIPQIQGYVGGADVWTRGTGAGGADEEKPDAEPIIKDVQVSPVWIAAKATVRRELLLNVKYLSNTISNTLIYSKVGLYARENKLIIDYIEANATAYAGDKTIVVEKLLDAAFGQMLAGYIIPTHILMNNSDYLTHIKFNKAAGSGEYDLPNEELKITDAQGIERSVMILPVPDLAKGKAYVIGSNEFEFINRLNPELIVSREHDKNLTVNKVTFLAEEMVAIIAKDLTAMVSVTLTTAP